jgi:hypothetical protein
MNPSSSKSFAYWPFWMVLAVLILVFPVYTWHENTSGFLTDDGVYLLMADFFSPYYHGNPAVLQLMMDQARFPPAFPVLIGLLGGGSENMHAAHLIMCGTFIASAVFFYIWARRTLGARDIAAACVVVYALLPKTLVYVTELWSEYLYMVFVFAALILLDLSKRPRGHSRELLCACALLIGLSILTRMAGLALLAAFVVFLYVNAVRRKYLYIFVAAFLPVCWEAIKFVNHYGGGYTGDLDQYLSPHGAAKLLLHDMPNNAFLLLQSWGRHFSAAPGSPWMLQAFAGVLLLLALAGAARRALAGAPDLFYIAFYIAMVLIWPYPAHNTRFLYPLVPLALVYTFTGLSGLTRSRWARTRSLSEAALLLLILLMIFPNAAFVANRFLAPVPSYIPEDYRHTREWLRGDIEDAYHDASDKSTVVRLTKRIGEHVSPRACVYSAHPVTTMLYSDRMSIIVPRHVSIRKLTSCRYLFAMNLKTEYPPYYPLHKVNPDSLVLLDSELDRRGRPQALLFRIRH